MLDHHWQRIPIFFVSYDWNYYFHFAGEVEWERLNWLKISCTCGPGSALFPASSLGSGPITLPVGLPLSQPKPSGWTPCDPYQRPLRVEDKRRHEMVGPSEASGPNPPAEWPRLLSLSVLSNTAKEAMSSCYCPIARSNPACDPHELYGCKRALSLACIWSCCCLGRAGLYRAWI